MSNIADLGAEVAVLKASDFSVERCREPLSNLELLVMRERIEAALRVDLSGMSIWEVFLKIENGEFGVMRVWARKELQACLVVTVQTIAPGARALHVVACGGGMMDHWLAPVLDELRAWARDAKCEAITLSGRQGWERVLRDYGYKRQSVLMKLELEKHG